jgi:hypothetical protein
MNFCFPGVMLRLDRDVLVLHSVQQVIIATETKTALLDERQIKTGDGHLVARSLAFQPGGGVYLSA